jgi:hypothetical protein
LKSCPLCKSKTGVREIFYGLPDGPVVSKKYVTGGCCISDNDPTVKCIECGWKGEFIDNTNGWKRGTKFVDLADRVKVEELRRIIK